MFTRNQFRNQKVLVAGCGRFGACLAAALSEAGYDILVIDKQKSAVRRLSDSFQGFEIEGDASVRFRDEVELDQEFSMNRSSLPDDETGTAQEETVQTESETEPQMASKETAQQTEQVIDQGSVVGVDPSIADYTGEES